MQLCGELASWHSLMSETKADTYQIIQREFRRAVKLTVKIRLRQQNDLKEMSESQNPTSKERNE